MPIILIARAGFVLTRLIVRAFFGTSDCYSCAAIHSTKKELSNGENNG
ncbi:hypothetical protein SAMN05216599_12042 [Pseudomonas cichorii]|nr:hypothetical protein SAMN05216599_12042 [Pseudomonas cichorii]